LNQQLLFEPLSFGMMLDRTFRLYLNNIWLMLSIALIANMPLILITLVSLGFAPGMAQAGLGDGPLFWFLITLGGLGTLAVTILVMTLSTGAATYAISNRYLGRDVTVSDCYKAAFSRFGALFWAQLVVGLLTLLGTLLCIIPGIYVAVIYMLLVPVVMLEGQGASDSRARANKLLEDYRWVGFGLAVIYALVSGSFSGGIHFASVMFVMADLPPALIVVTTDFIPLLVEIVITPLASIGIIVLYYDCRIRKEGYDLELMAENLNYFDLNSSHEPNVTPGVDSPE